MKIWIYQCNRPLTDSEKDNISAELEEFTGKWNTHGKKLKAQFEIPYNHFIVLKVDEEMTMASGCSIDDSVRFMKAIEIKYNLSLFDRQKVAYIKDDEIQVTNLQELSSLFEAGILSDDSIIFNNLISTNEEYEKIWKSPLKSTAYMNFI